MTSNELKRRFPNASPSFLAANSAAHTGEDAIVEPTPTVKPLAKKKLEKTDSKPILIRIVSIRKRLLDEDNLAEKWIVDCLRYCGAIPGDEPHRVKIQTTQRQTIGGESEYTSIEIIP